MKKIGVITCKDYPDFQKDEQLLSLALPAVGLEAEPVIWENAAQGQHDLSPYSLLVFRSCWNYHYHQAAFDAWLNDLEVQALPVWNPVSLVRWNLNKRYLLQLQAAGITIVPTHFSEPSELDWVSQAQAQNWQDYVIKPIVSAWGANTYRVSREELPGLEAKIRPQAQTVGLMLQPFVPQIAEGEWSLVYYKTPEGQRFSHAFVKRPALGAFLSHEEFGASWAPAEAAPFMFETAEQALSILPGDWLYARIDGVVVGQQFWIMELEVFEPSLYLAADPGAPGRLAQALATRLA
ncbi:MAG: hypothetical protein IV090_10390 [Candidatus Sericytochromatia bacterium]|nr:hypothetical protein [Candidatus Sericytochromatia bacterium]